MNYLNNPLLASDSYKYSHFQQYPAGAQITFSYIEARGTQIEGVEEVVLFGLQKYITDLVTKPITMEHVEEAKVFMEAHGEPFNYDGWKLIVDEYNGYLPLTIRAVPEGTAVPLGNVMVTVENSDTRLPWLPSFVETEILRSVWYGSTVATLSREIKKTIKKYLDLTSDNPDAELPFKLHDFGARGVSSEESAAIGGAAHLVNFMGTDTVSGIAFADHYYDAGVCGFSIPAAEHSTMTMRGRDNEKESYQAMIDAYAKPGKIFAVVSDSYDVFLATRDIWCRGGLLQQVKEKGATVVIRPDSGDPILTPIRIIEILMDELEDEVITNNKGYKVLPDYVRVIQGDGIDADDVRKILHNMQLRGFSASNIAFGMGGGLLQKVNRDTFKFAMKCSAAVIDHVSVDVYKDPITDKGKSSKKGFISLYMDWNLGQYVTMREEDAEHSRDTYVDALQSVYTMTHGYDEPVWHHTKFEDVRALAGVL